MSISVVAVIVAKAHNLIRALILGHRKTHRRGELRRHKAPADKMAAAAAKVARAQLGRGQRNERVGGVQIQTAVAAADRPALHVPAGRYVDRHERQRGAAARIHARKQRVKGRPHGARE